MADLGERWRALSPYLDEALLLDGPERAAWLRELEGREPGLAAELAELLARDAAAERDRFLGDGAPLAAAGAGATIGAYTLDELVGHGGMGEVWLAHRSDGRYQGKVAFKFLSVWRVGPAVAARFRREGEILARVTHPNIAGLVDAGTSEAGQPYLVLEYVDGAPIDQACDARRLDVEGRIRLFLDVLEAVAHAHRHLVVHRDIKPSNVMVSREGRVKLLDFGIAKLVEETAAGPASTLTRDAGAPLTPEFAAPEQLEGGAVTTATDVFALGGLLYLLLTGRHFSGLEGGTPAEVLRARLQADPPKPSAAATASRSSAEAEGERAAALRAEARGTTPNQLRRALAGDVDNILMKALARDPGKRYPSAAAFADDLRRYLDHEPVTARQATWPYLAARFVRRHWVPVTLGAVAGLSLVAGLTIALAQAREARRQRSAAIRQMHVAEATNSFTSFLLSNAAATGKPFTVGELVARGEEALEHQFRPDSPMRIHLLIDLSEHYGDLDDYPAAERLASRALDLSGDRQEPLARAVAICHLAFYKAVQGRLDEAGRLIDVSRGILDRIRDPDLVGAACLVADSLVSIWRGQLDRAIASASRARDIAQADPDSPPDKLEEALSALATAQSWSGQAAAASASYAALDAAMRVRGRDRTGGAAIVLNNWATHLSAFGQVGAAMEVAERAAKLQRDLDPSKGAMPYTLGAMAGALTSMGSWDRAEAVLGEAQRNVRSRHSTNVQQPLYVLLRRLDLYAESRQADRLSMGVAELERAVQAAHLPPDDPWHAAVLLGRGRLALLSGAPGRAVDYFDGSVRLARAKEWEPTRYRTIRYRAEALAALGRLDEAETGARAVVRWADSRLGGFAHSYLCAEAYRVLGQVLDARGDHDGAAREWHKAYEHYLDTVGPDAPGTRWVAARLGLTGTSVAGSAGGQRQ